MARKILVLMVLSAFCALGLKVQAQSVREAYKQQFEAYRQQEKQGFQDYKKEQQEQFRAYTDAMRKQWQEYKVNAKMQNPLKPKPTVQPDRPAEVKKENRIMPVAETMVTVEAITRQAGGDLDDEIPDDFLSDLVDFMDDDSDPEPEPEPAPVTLVCAAGDPAAFNFTYRQSPSRVRMGQDFKVSLAGVDENSCADAWEKLTQANIAPLRDDCMKIKKNMRLSDWGYMDILRAVGDAYYKDKNMSTLFQFMMLVNEGYQVRLCRNDNNLMLMACMKDAIFGYSFVAFDGPRYYILSQDDLSNCYAMDMPKEGTKPFSLSHTAIPNFPYKGAETRTLKLKGDDDQVFTLKVKPNKNLMEYYNAYPLSERWNYYVNTSLSREMKHALYPLLKKQLSGKSEEEAVNYLLHFVQKSLAYKTDDQQFGYERPLFGDESFFYPYNDCEDRAILLSILVGDLLGLDAVLLEYEDHVTTAIRFNQEVTGSYFELDDGKYYCCDPTYIGAGVGESMPQYAEKQAKIVRL